MSNPLAHPFVDVIPSGTDYRDMGPTLDCPCGCNMIYLLATLDPETRNVGLYFTDALCARCGSLIRAATPADDAEAWPAEFTEEDFYEPSGADAAEAARVNAQVEDLLKYQEEDEARLREQSDE